MSLGVWLIAGVAQAEPRDKEFGLGGMLGDPTGISVKHFFSDSVAVDGALGAGFFGGTHLLIHSNVLWHADIDSWDAGAFLLYGGAGARIGIWTDDDDDEGVRFGPRGVGGGTFHFREVPVDIFLEFGLGLWFIHGVDLDLDAALGARYWF